MSPKSSVSFFLNHDSAVIYSMAKAVSLSFTGRSVGHKFLHDLGCRYRPQHGLPWQDRTATRPSAPAQAMDTILAAAAAVPAPAAHCCCHYCSCNSSSSRSQGHLCGFKWELRPPASIWHRNTGMASGCSMDQGYQHDLRWLHRPPPTSTWSLVATRPTDTDVALGGSTEPETLRKILYNTGRGINLLERALIAQEIISGSDKWDTLLKFCVAMGIITRVKGGGTE